MCFILIFGIKRIKVRTSEERKINKISCLKSQNKKMISIYGIFQPQKNNVYGMIKRV